MPRPTLAPARRPAPSPSGVRLARVGALCGLGLAGRLLWPGEAVAAPAIEEVEARERRARTLYAAGEYRQALAIYAELYAETMHPTILRNIGRCHQNLGEADKAIAALREYLRKAKNLDAGGRAEIEGYIGEMEALKRARPGTEPIAVAPSSALPQPTLAARGAPTPPAGAAAPSSRAGRLGAFVRADFGVRDGLQTPVLLPGLSYGVGQRTELGVAAFIGDHKGGYLGGRASFADGSLRPNLSLGVVAIWPERSEGEGRELHPGAQAGAGLEWAWARSWALSLDVTATFFPNAARDIGPTWLVPSLAARWWP